MQESIVFLLRVQCRREESSRSLSHLLMSFLLTTLACYFRCTSIIALIITVIMDLIPAIFWFVLREHFVFGE